MRLTNHLVVFARAPRIGRVKTRLAADIGVLKAWAFARNTLKAVVRPLADDPRWRCWLAVTPDTSIFQQRFWPQSFGRITQGPGDLGRRMAGVAKSLPPGPVVIVGTDVPAIRPDHAASAFKALGRHDAVFGPARDGGYWLVGLKRRPAFTDIFEGVRWSTEHALSDTIANLKANQTHTVLESLDDIDDTEAYRRFMQTPTPSSINHRP
ncbi:MAG: TIGR04282 family arsenosugar biosynthesis glycosyltransferase [Proteobacteria bacterium]|nr:TIGR04282 family arsenosugar biosynthesis glycosyltransferase [Pseudomonadota bacterium]